MGNLHVTRRKMTSKAANESTDLSIIATNLQNEANPLIKKLSVMDITTKDEYDLAGERMANLKEVGSRAKAKMDEIIDPLKLSVKRVEELFKPFINTVKELETQTKAKMIDFIEKQEAAQRKLEADLDSGKVKSIASYHKKASALTTESESVSIREIEALEIFDLAKIPREYMVPNEAAIRAALKEGKKVAGARMIKKKSLAI